MTEQEMITLVAESYSKTGSFKKTAAELHISTAKVRKALLTAGVWTNDTAEEIAKLRSEHETWTDQQVADHMHISLNAVQMYTPYKMGPYEGDSPSAKRMAEYRARNKRKASDADKSRLEVGDMITDVRKEQENTEKIDVSAVHDNSADIVGADPFDIPLDNRSWYEEEQRKAKEQGLPFAAVRHNDDPDAKPFVDDQFFLDYRLVEPAHDQERHPDVKAMKIRLSVDTEHMSAAELEMIEKEYGVKRGWTRDLIVPSYIPLHYLHYIIQRAFGFEDTADHLFQLDSEQFETITEESLRNYCRLCGVLFRFPFGNDEEMYWDDDYDARKSIRKWLKEKYEGAWDTDAGTGYKYVDNQYRIWQWLGDKVHDFHKFIPAFESEDFYETLKKLGAPEEYSIGELDEAGVDEIEGMGQFSANNILESLSLDDIMIVEPEVIDFMDFADGLETAEDQLLDDLDSLEKANEKMKEAQELNKVLEKKMKSGRWDEDTLLVRKWRETAREAARLYVLANGCADIPFPFTDHIDYLYDFGAKKGADMRGDAKWRIHIKVLEEFLDNSIYYSRNYTPSDANGVRFEKDPEHENEWADRLLEMCRWKEKLEIIDSKDRWIRPSDDSEMMIKLRPEQELLDTERERIEKDRKNREEWRIRMGYEKEKEVVVDDTIYKAVRTAMLEHRPVCIAKEGTEPGEGYPDSRIRNTSIENLV